MLQTETTLTLGDHRGQAGCAWTVSSVCCSVSHPAIGSRLSMSGAHHTEMHCAKLLNGPA